MSAARSALLPCAAAVVVVALTVTPALADPLALPLPAPLPPVRVLTLLIMVHVLGVCFGLGGATMLDFWILRWLRWGGLPGEIARIFGYVSKVCFVGLVLLWVSGLGFLAIYALESPEKFGNPKLWAKVTVVLALTFNGIVIHHTILPGILRDVSRPMFQGLTGLRAGIFLASGAISGISWYTAFALGIMKELNGTVAYGLLVGLWLATIAAATLGGLVVLLVLRDGPMPRRRIPLPVPIPAPLPLSLPVPANLPLSAVSGQPPGLRIPLSRIVRIGAGIARP